ncbi:MAG: hypothetical protein AAGK97_05790, partial [Bacteroidota bacterium]
MKNFLVFTMLLMSCFMHGQNVGIGTNTPDPSAALEVQSTNKGLLIPRVDTQSVANPTEGLMIFQNSDKRFYFYSGSAWQFVGEAPSMVDGDNDTRIELEASLDDDIIRFFVKGQEVMAHDSARLILNHKLGSMYIGNNAGLRDELGNNNLFIGKNAGMLNESGTDNTFIGHQSGQFSIDGNNNVFLGRSSAANFETGDQNVYIGYAAGGEAETNSSVLIGASAGFDNTGDNNTMVGHFAGDGTGNSRDNVHVGYEAGQNSNGERNVFIGYQAGKNLNGNDLLAIHNSSTNSPLITGRFSSRSLSFNGETRVINEDLVIANSSSSTRRGMLFEQNGVPLKGIVHQGGLTGKLHFQSYHPAFNDNAMTIDFFGRVGIGNDNPIHKLSVEGASSGSIMKIENTSTSSVADGLEIKLGRDKAGRDNHFITFNNANSTAGRIEGFRVNEGFNLTNFPAIDFAKYFNLPSIDIAFSRGSLPTLSRGTLPTLNYGLPSLSIVRPTLSGGVASFSFSTYINCILSAGFNCSNPFSFTPITFNRGSWTFD